MRGGGNRELSKRENQWNNRIVQAVEPRRLPKVPKYRRHNGEEVKAVLFTGATRSKSTSKRNGGSANSIRQQQQYHYHQHQFHLQQADYHRQSLNGGDSLFGSGNGSVYNENEMSPAYHMNDIKYHRFTDQMQIQQQEQQQLLVPQHATSVPIVPPLGAAYPVDDGTDEYENESYEEYQDDGDDGDSNNVWDGTVDVIDSYQNNEKQQQHLPSTQYHQPIQPQYPKPAIQNNSPIRRSTDNNNHRHHSKHNYTPSEEVESKHQYQEKSNHEGETVDHDINIEDNDNDDDDAKSVNVGQLTIDIQRQSILRQETPRREEEINALLTERKGRIDKSYLLKKLSHIGRGSSSTVYKTFHSGRFEVVAEKVMVCSSKTRKVELIRELASLRALLDCDDNRKQYIVGLLDVIGTSDDDKGTQHPHPSVSVCLEYMHASLQDIVDSGGCSKEIVLSGMTRQMLLGLSFIHERRFLHRDFKPGNVLVNSKGMVKISDLGLCIDLPKGNSLAESFTGTYHYMSPERIEGGTYGYSSDVWGLGMTVLACAMGCYPFDEKRGYWALLAAIKDEPVPSPDSNRFSPECCEFIELATKKAPDERATTIDLLQHAFITKNWRDVENHHQDVENLNLSPRSNHYIGGGSVRDSGENNIRHDAMKTSNEWIRTSINSLTRRQMKVGGGQNNNKKKVNHGTALRATKSANDRPCKEVGRKNSAGQSSVNDAHYNNHHNGQLVGDSVMLTARGKLMIPEDKDGILSSEDSELRMVLKAFKKYLQYVWKEEATSSSPHKAAKDDIPTIDPLNAVTPTSLGILAIQINHPPIDVRKQFLSLIKSLQTVFLSAIKENEKLNNVLYGSSPTQVTATTHTGNNNSGGSNRIHQLSKPLPSKMAPKATAVKTTMEVTTAQSRHGNYHRQQQQQYQHERAYGYSKGDDNHHNSNNDDNDSKNYNNHRSRSKEPSERVLQLAKPRKDDAMMPKPLQLNKKTHQRNENSSNNGSSSRGVSNPQPPLQHDNKQNANLRLIRAKLQEKKKFSPPVSSSTRKTGEQQEGKLGITASSSHNHHYQHQHLSRDPNPLQLEENNDVIDDFVEEGPLTGRQFDDIFHVTERTVEVSEKGEKDYIYDNDIDINIVRQTSVVVDQNFHRQLSRSNQQLMNEEDENNYEHDYQEDEEEVVEEDINHETTKHHDNENNNVESTHDNDDVLYDDDHEVPIPSGLAAEAAGEGGLSMTYLDEYFDEYAEEFASGPLPSEAIGLDGVSPEKQQRGSRDVEDDRDGVSGLDGYRQHGIFDDDEKSLQESEFEPEQMLPAELGVKFTESLTLGDGEHDEDVDGYEMDEFDYSKDENDNGDNNVQREEEEVPSLASSPPKTSSEPQHFPNTQPAPLPLERKSAAMERVLEVGEKVQGKYDGGNRWYAGVIAVVNHDGTYDIQYNDGDYEYGVVSSYIRAMASKTPSANRPQPVVRTVRTLEPAIKKVDHHPQRASVVHHRASTPKLSTSYSQIDDDDDPSPGSNGQQQQEEREQKDIDLNEEIDEGGLEHQKFKPIMNPNSRDDYSIDFEDDDCDNARENMQTMISARLEHTSAQRDGHINGAYYDFDNVKNDGCQGDERMNDTQNRPLHKDEQEQERRRQEEEEQEQERRRQEEEEQEQERRRQEEEEQEQERRRQEEEEQEQERRRQEEEEQEQERRRQEKIREHEEQLNIQSRQRELEDKLEKDEIDREKRLEREKQVEEERLKRQELDRQEREKILIVEKQLKIQLKEDKKRKKDKNKDKHSKPSSHHLKSGDKKKKEKATSKRHDDLKPKVENANFQDDASSVEKGTGNHDDNDNNDLYSFDSPIKEIDKPRDIQASELSDHLSSNNVDDDSDNKHHEFGDENFDITMIGDTAADDTEFYEDDFEF